MSTDAGSRAGWRSANARRASALLGSIIAALMATPAWSAGIGGNFTFGSSEGRVEDTDDFFLDIDTSADVFEIGVSFDTNLARNRLVNYRLNANLQIIEQKLNQGAVKVRIDGSGFALNQLVGFGFVRTPRVRAFVGPTLHLGIAGFDDHETVQGVRLEYEEALFTAGIGPEIGMNYHIGKHFTVSVTGYYRYGLQLQVFDSPYTTSSSDDRTFTGHEHRVGLTTAFFFRFGGDQFKKPVHWKRKRPVVTKPPE